MIYNKMMKWEPSYEPRLCCDPNVCACCQYIGDGDFVCDKYFELVVTDWEPTQNFLMCR